MSTKRAYRQLKPELKFQIVLETFKSSQTQAEIGRKHNLHPQLINNWKKEFLAKGPAIFKDRKTDTSKDKKIGELEALIGRQTVEIQFLKKALEHLD